MTSTVVIALGGNALQQKGETHADAQERVARLTAARLVPLIHSGHRVVIVHGNGPQVGNIVLHEEAINTASTPTMPLDSCVAMSQGLIGYWLQQALTDELRKSGDTTPVATVVTRTLVDTNDQAFANPTKPIGPFYTTEHEARSVAGERGFVVKEDAGRGWRRVVPSPYPIQILEIETIRQLLRVGTVVIAGGGGGIPVIAANGSYTGVEAVIDKDFSAAVIANAVEADSLRIITTVDAAMIQYGTPDQKRIAQATVEEMQRYISDQQFAQGSMLPKVEAAVQFVEGGEKRYASITSIEHAADNEEYGTVIRN